MYKLGESKFDVEKSLKYKVIKKIFDNIDLSLFKYEVLEFKTDLTLSKFSDKVYFSLNCFGINYLLIFTKIDNKFYSFIINRKTLNYNIKNVNLQKVELEEFVINLKGDISIYENSIFDGILSTQGNKKYFYIADVYTFKGESFINKDLKERSEIIYKYFSDNYVSSKIEVSMLKIFDIEESIGVINNLEIKTRGYCFHPKYYGCKLLYLLGNVKKEIINKENENVFKEETREEDFYYMPKKFKDIEYVFEMRKDKNNTPDIYYLFVLENVNVNDKQLIKKKKFGLVYIKNIEKSRFCRDLISNKESILINCIFYPKIKKWEPLQLSSKTEISNIKDFKRMLI